MDRLLPVFTLLAVTVAVPTVSRAVTLPFTDNFEDGSATDGSPATWIQGGDLTADQSVIDGSLVIASAGANSPARLDGVLPADLSVLTQVRFLATDNANDAAALEVRNDGSGFLIALLSAEGGLTIGSLVPQVGFSVLATGTAPVDPVANETLLRFDAFGSEVGLTAWELGTPQPDPQVTVTTEDLLGVAGSIGAGISVPSGEPATVAFRFVEAIPEPASSVMIASAVVFACSQRTRRAR